MRGVCKCGGGLSGVGHLEEALSIITGGGIYSKGDKNRGRGGREVSVYALRLRLKG